MYHQGQELQITGTAGDGKRYLTLACVVATVSLSEPKSIKVWPLAEVAIADDGSINETGKLWFELSNIENAESQVIDHAYTDSIH